MSWLGAVVPGLWVGVLFVLLLAVLRRWYDPVPVRVAVPFAILVVLLFGRALFFGAVLLPLDLLWNTPPFQDMERTLPGGFVLQADQVEDLVPYYAQTRRLLRRGEWPLAADLIGAGEPFLGNSQAQHFHPLHLLTYILPLFQAVGAVAALKVLLCLSFSYLLLRRCGIGEGGAMGGAVAYGMSGFLFQYLGWPQTQSAAALPILLYAVELSLVRRERRDQLLLALAVATLILGGHPETIVYVAGTAALFAVERVWCLLRDDVRPVRLAALAPCGLALLLGIALTAPVLLPTLATIEQSERRWLIEYRNEYEAERGWREALVEEGGLEALEKRIVPVAAPLAYGSDRYSRSWGFSSIIHDGSAFAGTATLLLVLLGLPLGRRRARYSGERSLGLVALAALVVFLRPLALTHLLRALPLLDQSGNDNRRLSMLVCFGFAFLAAVGWDRAQRLGVSRLLLVTLSAAMVGFLFWAYLAHPHPTRPSQQLHPRLAALYLQVGVVGVLAALLWRPRSGERLRAPVGALALLTAFELFQLHAPLVPLMPRSHFFPQRPSISFLQQHLGSDRMVALGGHFRHNYPVLYGLADVRSGNPLHPATMSEVMLPLRRDRGTRSVLRADHPLYDLLGVRYVVAGPDAELKPPLQLVFRRNVSVWERSGALPRVFFPATAEKTTPEAWPRQLSRIRNFSHRALADRLPEGEERWHAATGAAPLAELTVGASEVVVGVRLAAPRLLASSLYQDGGWRVLLDGRLIESVVTNGVFVGAWLPAGEHDVRLVYRPPAFLVGCLLAALALVSGAALLLAEPGSRGRG